MGANWIKMRKDLKDDPRVAAIGRALDRDIQTVLGALYLWFAYADQHGKANDDDRDGTMTMVDYDVIDSPLVTGIPGMANQLERVGWIKMEGDNLRVVGYHDHMGSGAKGRAVNAARQGRRRRDVTHDALPDKTRQDETRQETALRGDGGGASWDRESGFEISDEFRKVLTEAYPDVDLDHEIRNAHAWKVANPSRKHKRIGRFLRSWMSRAQEQAAKDAKQSNQSKNPRNDLDSYDFDSLGGKK